MVCCEGHGDIFIIVRSGINDNAPEFAHGMLFSNGMLCNNDDKPDKCTNKSHWDPLTSKNVSWTSRSKRNFAIAILS